MAERKIAATVNGVEEGRKTGFWVGKDVCWEKCGCPEMVRAECPAMRYQFLPCWEIEGTYCKLDDRGSNGRDTSICRTCPVYRTYGQGQEIKLKLFGRGLDTGLKNLEKIVA